MNDDTALCVGGPLHAKLIRWPRHAGRVFYWPEPVPVAMDYTVPPYRVHRYKMDVAPKTHESLMIYEGLE